MRKDAPVAAFHQNYGEHDFLNFSHPVTPGKEVHKRHIVIKHYNNKSQRCLLKNCFVYTYFYHLLKTEANLHINGMGFLVYFYIKS